MPNKISYGLLVLLGKLLPKFIYLLVKATPKLLKGGKVFQVGSAGIAMGAWSLMFSWQFALLIMLLLVVHESGHVWAMKRSGMKTNGIYFIPFLGAAAVPDGMFPSRQVEVFVAIMGPIWGLALSAIALLLWYALGWPHFVAAAAWMATVNLFNLLPISPLDGGRILKSVVFSIDSRIGIVFLGLSLVVAAYLMLHLHLLLFSILLVFGMLEFVFELEAHRRKRNVNNRPGNLGKYDIISSTTTTQTPMGKHGIFGSLGVYSIVAIFLYLIMTAGSGVPGAGNPVQIFS